MKLVMRRMLNLLLLFLVSATSVSALTLNGENGSQSLVHEVERLDDIPGFVQYLMQLQPHKFQPGK